MNKLFMEKNILKVIGGPVDFNDAAITGARVDMSKIKSVAFAVIAAAGTTPSSHTVSFKQHTVASSGTPADLEIDNPWYHQVATATEFTKVVPTAKAASFDIDTIVGDTKFVAVFEVKAEDLTDGYRWVSCNLTDSGGAQLGCILAIGHDGSVAPLFEVAV